jgi:large subunit ribosomal protein L29
MRPSEVRDLSEQELETKERELREELFRLRLRQKTQQLEQTHRLVQVRRDIARVQTVRRQREQRG